MFEALKLGEQVCVILNLYISQMYSYHTHAYADTHTQCKLRVKPLLLDAKINLDSEHDMYDQIDKDHLLVF